MEDSDLGARLDQVDAHFVKLEELITALALRMSVVATRVTDAEKIQKIALAEVRRLAAQKWPVPR
jgi:hypothetical protein